MTASIQLLSSQIAKGAIWNTVGTVVKQGTVFAATVIVARLLTPTDYAIGGLGIAIMGFFTIFTAQGFAQALVQRDSISTLTCNSVFWFMLLAGIAIGSLAFASSSWIARFYQQPALQSIISVLALGLFAGMVGAVPNALLQRAMRFGAINLIGIGGGVLSAILGVGLALCGHGYWALIAPGIGSVLATTLGAFWLSGYRPFPEFKWSEFRTISNFGFALLGSNLVLYLNDNGMYLILGRAWPSLLFGQFYFASERSLQPLWLVTTQLASVTFAGFSRLQGDRSLLARAFISGTQIICTAVFPLYVLLIGLADPLIPWLFGGQWRTAIPIFQAFSACAFLRAFAALVPGSLLAVNRAQSHLIFNLFRASAILPALAWLRYKHAGPTLVAAVLTVIAVTQLPFFIGYLFRQIGLKGTSIWHNFRPLIFATFVMVLPLGVIRALSTTSGWPPWFILLLSTTTSLCVFALLLRRAITEMVKKVWAAVAV